MSGPVSGAHILLDAVRAAGVRICFANPGTTELAIVRALNAVPGMRAVLGLFEGVCTGAADGYARVAREPALTLPSGSTVKRSRSPFSMASSRLFDAR